MDTYTNLKKRCVIDICDYKGNKKCSIYDSSSDVSGQATDIVVTTNRNGYREISFTLPSTYYHSVGLGKTKWKDLRMHTWGNVAEKLWGDYLYEEEVMREDPNYRLDFLKADYRIRLIDDNANDPANPSSPDWFLISEPKITHKAFSQDVTVTASHISQLLKTKQMNLVFSDQEGNSVGTAEELLTAVLDGTGWSVGHVDDFYEKDGSTIKVRTLNAQEKTGAFKLVSMIADLFEAKPIYYCTDDKGNVRKVDLVHMNPFTKKAGEYIPEAVIDDHGVLELHYGTNVNNITRTINTENIVTSLYPYGAYGDVATGMCNISECNHYEYEYTLTADIQKGQYRWFEIVNPSGVSVFRSFKATDLIPYGSKLIWSDYDPASRSYIWLEDSSMPSGGKAYAIESGQKGTQLQATTPTEPIEKQNILHHLMDFSYYQAVGLFDDDMLQELAQYQRNVLPLIQIAEQKSLFYSNELTELNKYYIGETNFCKLNIVDQASVDGKLKLILDPEDRLIYHSDDEINENKFFNWTKADRINGEGDAMSQDGLSKNPGASVVYLVHRNNDGVVTSVDKTYIKAFNHDVAFEEKLSTELTLWINAGTFNVNNDSVYLFERLTTGGYLGVCEDADFAAKQAAKSKAIYETVQHQVFYQPNMPTIGTITPTTYNGFAFWWDTDSTYDTKFNIYYYDEDDPPTGWNKMYCQKSQPDNEDSDEGDFWYKTGSITRSDSEATASLIYRRAHGEWFEYNKINKTSLKSAILQIYNNCFNRDIYRYGEYESYSGNIAADYPKGNYYCYIDYGRIVAFTTEETMYAGSLLEYLRSRKMFSIKDGATETIVTCQTYSLNDGYVHVDPLNPSVIVVGEDTKYYPLITLEGHGHIAGLEHVLKTFPAIADKVYGEYAREAKEASDRAEKARKDMIEALGDTYREGYWQKQDYVDGDEQKLYDDAIENLEEISQPDVKYNIGYLDRYGSNMRNEYYSDKSNGKTNLFDQRITTRTAVHLVDPEINVNEWAFIDEIKDCKDMPWKSNISINTNLSTVTQHSFADVIANIANVASQMKFKAGVYDRSKILGTSSLAAERLEGAIDAAKLKLFGTASTWETDERGNIIFTSADGASSMALTGNGFAIADKKDENGDWLWRTAGTGEGLVADAITTGYLSAERIESESITVNHLAPNVGEELILSNNNSVIQLVDDKISSTVTRGSTYISEAEPQIGDTPFPDDPTRRIEHIYVGDYWVKPLTLGTWGGVKKLYHQKLDDEDKGGVQRLKEDHQWQHLIWNVEHYIYSYRMKEDDTYEYYWAPVNNDTALDKMQTSVNQTATEIKLEASRALSAEHSLESSISETAENIMLEVKDNYYGKKSGIEITDDGITLESTDPEETSTVVISPNSIDLSTGTLKVSTNHIIVKDEVTLQTEMQALERTYITEFCVSDSSTKFIKSSGYEWDVIAPTTIPDGKFLWEHTVVKNGTGETVDTITEVCISAVKGDPGSVGPAGKGVESIVEQYACNNDSKHAPTDGWENTPPKYAPETPYYWIRSFITFTDGSTHTGQAVLDNGTNEAISKAYSAEQKAQDIVDNGLEWGGENGVKINSNGVVLGATKQLKIASSGQIIVASNTAGKPNAIVMDASGIAIASNTEEGSNAIVMDGDGIAVASGGSIDIKAGGQFTVDSANFSIDEDGSVTISGDIKDENGESVISKSQLIISRTQPSAQYQKSGMVWIKPFSPVSLSYSTTTSSSNTVYMRTLQLNCDSTPQETDTGKFKYTLTFNYHNNSTFTSDVEFAFKVKSNDESRETDWIRGTAPAGTKAGEHSITIESNQIIDSTGSLWFGNETPLKVQTSINNYRTTTYFANAPMFLQCEAIGSGGGKWHLANVYSWDS